MGSQASVALAAGIALAAPERAGLREPRVLKSKVQKLLAQAPRSMRHVGNLTRRLTEFRLHSCSMSTNLLSSSATSTKMSNLLRSESRWSRTARVFNSSSEAQRLLTQLFQRFPSAVPAMVSEPACKEYQAQARILFSSWGHI